MALTAAVSANNTAIVRLLLATVLIRTALMSDWSPLMLASNEAISRSRCLLVKAGAKINASINYDIPSGWRSSRSHRPRSFAASSVCDTPCPSR